MLVVVFSLFAFDLSIVYDIIVYVWGSHAHSGTMKGAWKTLRGRRQQQGRIIVSESDNLLESYPID